MLNKNIISFVVIIHFIIKKDPFDIHGLIELYSL